MTSEITLKQLSKFSGFSISTVSKALNGAYDISEKTKHEVQKLAEKLDYVPNSTAKSLRTKKTNTLAVIVPQIECNFCSNLLSEIQKVAFNKGYQILIFQSLIGKSIITECIDNVRGRVDGIIIVNQIDKYDIINKNKTELSKVKFVPILIQNIEKIPLIEIKDKGEKSVITLIKQIDVIN